MTTDANDTRDERPEQGCDMDEYRAWERRLTDAKRDLSQILAEIRKQAEREGVAPKRGQDERDQPDSYV